jgi:hypothetical protein
VRSVGPTDELTTLPPFRPYRQHHSRDDEGEGGGINTVDPDLREYDHDGPYLGHAEQYRPGETACDHSSR